jgi:hypothetical protein
LGQALLALGVKKGCKQTRVEREERFQVLQGLLESENGDLYRGLDHRWGKASDRILEGGRHKNVDEFELESDKKCSVCTA